MAYKRKSNFKSNQNSTFLLNITSMTDMFTILLVFLLQTYASSDASLMPEPGLRLPTSNSELNPTRSLKIIISNTQLKLDDKILLTFKNGTLAEQDLDKNDSLFIPRLFSELEKISKTQKEGDPLTGKIMIQSDSSVAYRLLNKVMYTSSMAGFPKVKIATIAGE